jgi:hypothetical protein
VPDREIWTIVAFVKKLPSVKTSGLGLPIKYRVAGINDKRSLLRPLVGQ